MSTTPLSHRPLNTIATLRALAYKRFRNRSLGMLIDAHCYLEREALNARAYDRIGTLMAMCLLSDCVKKMRGDVQGE